MVQAFPVQLLLSRSNRKPNFCCKQRNRFQKGNRRQTLPRGRHHLGKLARRSSQCVLEEARINYSHICSFVTHCYPSLRNRNSVNILQVI
jgi:hypothetical protein